MRVFIQFVGVKMNTEADGWMNIAKMNPFCIVIDSNHFIVKQKLPLQNLTYILPSKQGNYNKDDGLWIQFENGTKQ